jgi:hypothetical protein
VIMKTLPILKPNIGMLYLSIPLHQYISYT